MYNSLYMYRKQTKQIIKDLDKKIVFIVGPRQVGKTWLSKEIGKQYEKTVYLNYDRLEDRNIIKNEKWLESTELLILDELHKMPDWKNFLKGIYDTKEEHLKIIVTGSARLDFLKQSGDSLAGRFFVHKLLPFSLSETKDTEQPDEIDKFISRGGFPEPFLAVNDIEADRWRSQYIDSLIRVDVLDFEKIHDFKAIQLILDLLRRRVGSPVSFTSIARDVAISPATVIKYVQIFEALYVVFRVTPYSKNIARSILKEPKIYFFDNGMVISDDNGVKIENFTAVSLLKTVFSRNDLLGEDNQLKYLRTKDGKEVDFALVNSNNKIDKIIEVKNSDDQLSKSLKYFSEKYSLQAVQVIKELKREQREGNITKRKMINFLKEI